MVNLWRVWLGRSGEFDRLAIDVDRISIDFGYRVPVSEIESSDNFRKDVFENYKSHPKGRATNFSVQIDSFVNNIKIGDFVFCPFKSISRYGFGAVIGTVENLEDGRLARAVHWIAKDITRSDLGLDLFQELSKRPTTIAQKKFALVDDLLAVVRRSEERLILGEDEVEEDFAATEGGRKLVQHLKIERNLEVVRMKKALAEKRGLGSRCEICDFNFSTKYGDVGVGFIECHHVKPLSQSEGETKTKISDLALLCSNCHRMVHRRMVRYPDLCSDVRTLRLEWLREIKIIPRAGPI